MEEDDIYYDKDRENASIPDYITDMYYALSDEEFFNYFGCTKEEFPDMIWEFEKKGWFYLK